MAECRSCGAEISWARSAASGSPMPIDAEPTPEGNVVYTGELVAGAPFVQVLGKGERDDRPRYMPHHATCPQGREWRGRRRRS